MVPASAEYGVPGADDEGIFADIAQGAKTSVDITYWPQALRARVELRKRCPNGSTGSTTGASPSRSETSLLTRPRPPIMPSLS